MKTILSKIKLFARDNKMTLLIWLAILLSAEATVTPIYEGKRIHAIESLAPGVFDTTTAPRYKAELRFRLADSTIYWFNARTSGRKWFAIVRATGPDTLANDVTYDTLLTNPSTGRYVWKSLNNVSSNGLTTTKTTAAGTISWSTVWGGTLSAQTDIAGGSQIVNIGTSGSKVSAFNVTSSGSFYLQGLPIYLVDVYSADAIHTVPANTGILELSDASITANRAITLPTATINGTHLLVINKGNNGSFFYTFGATVTDNTTAGTITNIGHRTTYLLEYDASLAWRIILKY